MWKAKTFAVNVLVGLVLAGPLAALALVALPEQWRGPAVPWTVVALAVALVALVRRPKRQSD
jgi:uncharacterized membrane protein YccC